MSPLQKGVSMLEHVAYVIYMWVHVNKEVICSTPNWLIVMHVSAYYATVISPFGSIFIPLALWVY